MESRSNRLANAFRSLGLGVGDHVAILMENRHEYFEAVWAGMRSGLFVTPINWHLAPDEVEYIVRDCGASVLVTSSACAALAQGAMADVNSRIVVGGAVEGFDPIRACSGSPLAVPDRRRVRRHLDVLFLGDDRTPEGHQATLCRRCARRGVIVHGLVRGLYGGDESTVYLSPAPLYHAAPSGWAGAVHRLGGTVVTLSRFDPIAFLRAIERFR